MAIIVQDYGTVGGGAQFESDVVNVAYNTVTKTSVKVPSSTYIAVAYSSDGSAGVKDTVNNITSGIQVTIDISGDGYFTIRQTESYSTLSFTFGVTIF